ncbi:MAG: hypothetical protein LBC76_03450 [Treponema sp.]|jgi:hypothetical protein|nr:hypothetical protein [Treponema sp.]
MDNKTWWNPINDTNGVSRILSFSIEARKWYLKTDVKVRLKRFILHHVEFEEIVYLWKRLNIIKKDFGEEDGSLIIQQAVQEINAEFSDPEWAKTIDEKIAIERKGLNDDFVKMM